MTIQGFCPPPSPPPSPSHSPYYQLLERGSARLGRVKKMIDFQILLLRPNLSIYEVLFSVKNNIIARFQIYVDNFIF